MWLVNCVRLGDDDVGNRVLVIVIVFVGCCWHFLWEVVDISVVINNASKVSSSAEAKIDSVPPVHVVDWTPPAIRHDARRLLCIDGVVEEAFHMLIVCDVID